MGAQPPKCKKEKDTLKNTIMPYGQQNHHHLPSIELTIFIDYSLGSSLHSASASSSGEMPQKSMPKMNKVLA